MLAVELVSTFPFSTLGVILGLSALGLGRTSMQQADSYPSVIGIGLLGGFFDLGVAFVLGGIAYRHYRSE